jgi:hypothetical protein
MVNNRCGRRHGNLGEMRTFAGLDAQVVDATLAIHREIGIRQITNLAKRLN